MLVLPARRRRELRRAAFIVLCCAALHVAVVAATDPAAIWPRPPVRTSENMAARGHTALPCAPLHSYARLTRVCRALRCWAGGRASPGCRADYDNLSTHVPNLVESSLRPHPSGGTLPRRSSSPGDGSPALSIRPCSRLTPLALRSCAAPQASASSRRARRRLSASTFARP